MPSPPHSPLPLGLFFFGVAGAGLMAASLTAHLTQIFGPSWPRFRGWRSQVLRAASRNRAQGSQATHSSFLPWGQGRGGGVWSYFSTAAFPVLLKALIDTSPEASAGRCDPTSTPALEMRLPEGAGWMGGGCLCAPNTAARPCPLSQRSQDLVGNLASHPESI